MRGGEPDTVQTINLCKVTDELAKRPVIAAFELWRGAVIGVYVLAEQVDLANALVNEGAGFSHNRVCAAGKFRAAGVRHNAERTEFIAAFLNGQEGRRAIDLAVERQGVEFFLDVEIGFKALTCGAVNTRDHFGELVISLRAEHEINSRLAAHDLFAFSLRNTARNAKQHFSAGRLFQTLELAQLRKHLLRRLLTDVTGVEENQIGIIRGLDTGIAQRSQNILHPFGIIDVHLTAIGFYKEAFGRRGHFSSFIQDFSVSSSGTA